MDPFTRLALLKSQTCDRPEFHRASGSAEPQCCVFQTEHVSSVLQSSLNIAYSAEHQCRVFRRANRLTSVVMSRRPRQSADAEGVCGDRYQPQHGLLHQRRYGAAEHADWRVMTTSPCIFTWSQ